MAYVKKRTRKNGALSYVAGWIDPDGIERQATFRTEREAKRHGVLMEADKARGVYADERLFRKTFREVADEWLATRTHTKPRTEAEYRRILDNRILPRFGNRQIGSLKAADSAAYIRALMEDGLKAETISRLFGPYKSILLFARRQGYLPNERALNVKLPTDHSMGREAFEPRFLSPAELQRLIESVSIFHPHYGLLVEFLALTGLRVGECAGLTVGDLAIWNGKGSVTVRRAVRGGEAGTTKTKASMRKVPLPPQLVEKMSAYLNRHPAKADADSPAPPSAPLWCGREPGSHYASDWIPKYRTTYGEMTDEQMAEWLAEDPMRKHHAVVPLDPDDPLKGFRPLDGTRRWDHGAFYKTVWLRAVGMAGLAPLRMHDLRHTYASLMAAAGQRMGVVSANMGHANEATTANIYTHLFASDVERAADALGAFYAAALSMSAENVFPIATAR